MTAHRGYTAIELLITLGLVTVVVLVAAQLVGASARVYHAAADGAAATDAHTLTALLRRDIQGASGVALQLPSWDQRPMELRGWDGRGTRYEADGNALIRETFDAAGARESRRVVATGVASWWWRMTSPRTVEVRVSLMPGRGAVHSATTVHRYTLQRRFSFRGWPDGRSW
jgi:prepilin-type N-terminal cleavage/methylation domain-containing protein